MVVFEARGPLIDALIQAESCVNKPCE